MIDELIQQYPHLPKVWGEGILCAFSGLDGRTDLDQQFVLTHDDQLGSLRVHTPKQRTLSVAWPKDTQIHGITGDVFIAETLDGPFVWTFINRQVLVGKANKRLHMTLTNAHPDLRLEVLEEHAAVRSVDDDGDCLVYRRQGDQFVLALGEDITDAEEWAAFGLDADVGKVIPERLRSYQQLPSTRTGREELLAKCWSVMRVNAHSPQGAIDCRWATPDRLTHRGCSMRDTAYHVIPMNTIDPYCAWDYLRAVFLEQRQDGMIPQMAWPQAEAASHTHPPMLAALVLENFKESAETDSLKWTYDKLVAYLQWFEQHRRGHHADSFVWHPYDAEVAGEESGQPQSPRFVDQQAVDAVDLAVYMIQEYAALSVIAHVLDKQDERAHYKAKADAVSVHLHAHHWNTATNLYHDRLANGSFSPVQSSAGFMPLLLESTPETRVDDMLYSLADAERFAGTAGLPTIAFSDPSWSVHGWQGGTLAQASWLLYQGLRRHKHFDVAEKVRAGLVSSVASAYHQHGTTFACYDPRGKESLPSLRLLGASESSPLNTRDYQATAAIVMQLLMDEANEA